MRFLFLRVLRYFSSPRYLRSGTEVPKAVVTISDNWISPFGNRRITAGTQLPDDYRGVNVLLRPNKPRHPPFALVYISKIKTF